MSELIVETTDATFELDVIERSRLTPVIVDFWAEWCQPCRMLAPLLEELAKEFVDRVTVVKADTEQCQQAATEFGVTGIPALFGVAGGSVVDGLQGMVPEETLRQFFVQMASRGALVEAESLEQSDPEKAAEVYKKLVEDNPEMSEAQIGLGRSLFKTGQAEAATEILEQLERRGFLEPAAEQLKSLLSLAVDDSGETAAQLQTQADANPGDHALAVRLAHKLASDGQHEQALQRALAVVEVTKTGPGEEARALMVDIFRALPDDSDLTREYRRKLSMALY